VHPTGSARSYELAFRQFEVSDTRVFDRPQAGRGFFEGVIRDHLDVGRPEQVALIFERKVTSATPGTFRTKVVTKGVDPQLCCYYRSARLKQYFKEHRALRTETVISDTRDFGIGRRVNAENWHALRAVGQSANRRLCDAEASDAAPAPDVATLQAVTLPSSTPDGLHAPGLRFGDPRVMALFSAIVGFAHLFVGFDNPALVRLVSTLLDRPYCSRQATYNLRRLRRKGLIERVPGTHRYLVTPMAGGWPCCSPRPTAASSPPALPGSTLPCPTASPSTAPSRWHGANSTGLWPLSSRTR
jgi:hypothetical protein